MCLLIGLLFLLICFDNVSYIDNVCVCYLLIPDVTTIALVAVTYLLIAWSLINAIKMEKIYRPIWNIKPLICLHFVLLGRGLPLRTRKHETRCVYHETIVWTENDLVKTNHDQTTMKHTTLRAMCLYHETCMFTIYIGPLVESISRLRLMLHRNPHYNP